MDKPPAITLIFATVPKSLAGFLQARADVSVLGQCSNGQEALDMILVQKPEFAILAGNMPKLTGLQVVRCVRETGSRTRLIVASDSI